MFVTGLPQLGGSFFTSASMMIAIPTGVQIFCWIATMWKGKIRLATPMMYVIGFFLVFIIGGLTGVMIASIPFDSQVHDTFFIVAHFHYTLIGGAVFPLLGAVYYWFPKVTGRMLDERMGKTSFWLLLVGFNLTFFPMHILGLNGMTRRIYTYLATTGWGDLNLLASIGAAIIAMSLLTTLVNAIRSLRRGVQAGDNPWGAPTLEWSTSSPPPSYNYLYLPIVEGHNPLWTSAHELPGVGGLSTEYREVLVVRALDAVPDHRHHSIGHSKWPLILALVVGAMLVGVIFTPWALPAGSALFTVALTGWYWPNRKLRKLEEEL
jgi:cytochrome c oxidase subunit 1